ncbi:hypothetical protein ACFQL7_07080 [Halocatena marina]|uniref:Hydroxypyruvate isomerase n=1 Tax=Halocatena marina TaxID=2934937 RepID=A0ABD5YQ62_9EURY
MQIRPVAMSLGWANVKYGNLFATIAEKEYDGYAGCELSPIGDPDTVMHDVRALREP